MWRKLHRQRLVAYSKAHPREVDAAFTEYMQCYPQQCSAMEAEYGKAPAVSFVEALDAHRFVASVDGNGYPMRTRGVLCSGSLALLGGIFASWLSPRLQAGVHYLPIRCARAEWQLIHWLLYTYPARVCCGLVAHSRGGPSLRVVVPLPTPLFYMQPGLFRPGRAGGVGAAARRRGASNSDGWRGAGSYTNERSRYGVLLVSASG